MPRAQHVFASVVLLGLLSACGQEAPKTGEVRPVRTVVVDPKPIDDDRQAVGEIKVAAGCPLAFERCRVEVPAMRRTAPGHFVACHLREGEPVESS